MIYPGLIFIFAVSNFAETGGGGNCTLVKRVKRHEREELYKD